MIVVWCSVPHTSHRDYRKPFSQQSNSLPPQLKTLASAISLSLFLSLFVNGQMSIPRTTSLSPSAPLDAFLFRFLHLSLLYSLSPSNPNHHLFNSLSLLSSLSSLFILCLLFSFSAMENSLPSSSPSPSSYSSSSSSTLPTYSNVLTTPHFSIDEPSSGYAVPQFIIPPCNNLQSPYACPIEQVNQQFNSCVAAYPSSMVQNGCEFGVMGSSVYAGLRQERGFLDPQRTKLARIKRKLARQRTLSLFKNSSSSSSSSSSSLCSNPSSYCSSSSSSNSNFPAGSNELNSRRSFMYKSHAEAQHRNSVAKGDHNLYQFCTSDNKV